MSCPSLRACLTPIAKNWIQNEVLWSKVFLYEISLFYFYSNNIRRFTNFSVIIISLMHMIGKILNWDTFFPSSIHAHVGSFIILIVGNIHICNKCLSWFSIFFVWYWEWKYEKIRWVAKNDNTLSLMISICKKKWK